MRILLICERLSGQDDEGIKNVARSLLTELTGRHEVLALAERDWPGHKEVRAYPMNRFFLNSRLLREARRFAPDACLYIPWTSGTPRTMFRGRVVKLATAAPVSLFLTQPYVISRFLQATIRPLLPDLVMAMEDVVIRQFRSVGVAAEFVPAGVDLERFRISSPHRRKRIREQLGLTDQDRLILHVGHLNRNRFSPFRFNDLARGGRYKPVVVGSPDTPQDPSLVRELESAGCIVIREYLPDIEEYYGAADAYLFPTTNERSCIGIPLSILEALACGVPVVTSRFGGLPRLFSNSAYLEFFSSQTELPPTLDKLPSAPTEGARALVENLTWTHVAARVETLLEEMIRRHASSVAR